MIQIISSESVNCGHPDKTCDIIADSFLDEALKQDPNSQMAVECAIKNNKLFIYGEATTKAKIDYKKIAQDVLNDVGYTEEFKITKEISVQSPDINQAVVKKELCANDQGMMYGYATNETAEYMPLPIIAAHKIMRAYDMFRRFNSDRYHSDAKCQVSVAYENGTPKYFNTILVSVSHNDNVEKAEIEHDVKEFVLKELLNSEYIKYVNGNTKFIINPSGKFTIWGSYGDSGCVGRKIVVDTYGGVGKVGGGCFSSKNSTKVDRSAAYYARYVAKNIVAKKFADRCEIQVAYGIGLAKPISFYLDCFGTQKVDYTVIREYVEKTFDFSLSNIIKELDLNKPIYAKTACYGHFGRNEFTWEKIK